MAGRKPIPTHLKLVKGNPGRRKLNAAEPTPSKPAVLPEPPAHMTRYAFECWRDLAVVLDSMGVLTGADVKALEMACEAYAECRECREAVELAGGGTYETRSVSGELLFRSRPEVARLSDADRRFKGYLGEFGLTPAARAKVKVHGKANGNDLDRYFS